MAERTLVTALVIKAVNQASSAIRQVATDLKGIQKQSQGLREVAGSLGALRRQHGRGARDWLRL